MHPRNKTRLLRWSAAVALLLLATLLFLLALSNRHDRVTLPNGLTVQWLGLTEGTNAFVDGNPVQKLLGDRIPAKGLNLGFTTITPPRKYQSFQSTGHVAWFRLSGTSPNMSYDPLGRNPDWMGFKVFFTSSSGRELEIPHPMPYTSSATNALFSIPMNAYPRNKPKVTLRIGTPSDGKTPQEWAEFEFKTPGRITKLPTWTLQTLPATNIVDGFPIVLRSASASKSELIISLPSSEWSVPECLIFDQEGNQYSWSRTSGPTPLGNECSISFPDSFGADRPWRMRMQVVHARGFAKRGFDNHPQRDFPDAIRRHITLSPGDPPVSITNSLHDVFSCLIEHQQLNIKGTTPARPYWAIISASEGTQELELNGYGWQNTSPQQPLGQQIFFLSKTITNLTLELACPQVLSTEFYIQPAE